MNTKTFLIAAAVAGMMSAGAMAKKAAAPKAGEAKGVCTESNSCKGEAHCAGVADKKEHPCAKKNECANNVLKKHMTKAECDAIKGTWAEAK